MANFTIKSRDFGEQSFFAPDSGGYVRLEQGSKHGTLGMQICYGGGFRGNTVRIDSPDELPTVAREWWRQYRKHQRIA